MSTTILEFRLREEMAGAVLKEVAALEPAERLLEADSLTHVMDQAVRGLEELWGKLSEPLQRGVSPSDAATWGRILTRSTNLIHSSLDLLIGESQIFEDFRRTAIARLQRIKVRAASLRRLIEMPAPEPDAQRLGRSLDQMSKGNGVDAKELLAEFDG